MNITKRIAAYIGVLLLSILSTSASGETILEAETGAADSNSVITLAQSVDASSGDLVIAGDLFFSVEFVLYPPPGMAVFRRDVDFYSFFASSGDKLVINIDGGIGGALSIDTKLGLFGPAPSYALLVENEDADSIDAGSVNFKDARIDGFRVPADGIYTVVVTGRGAVLMNGGDVMGGAVGAMGNGDYLLKISGSSYPANRVEIAITQKKLKKKGRKGKKHKAARIDLKKKRNVKVAIFGSKNFPVSDIDLNSLTFGAVGNENTLRKCKHRTKDLNRDGEPDLVCEFSLRHSGFSKDSREGVLNGQTSDGRSFSGANPIVVKGKGKGKG